MRCSRHRAASNSCCIRSKRHGPASRARLRPQPEQRPGLEFRSDLEPVPGEGHWFAIDRSVLASHGLTLTGPAAPTVFRSASRANLLPLLAETLRWFLHEGSPTEDAILNACRSLFYAREGAWTSKHGAGRWAGVKPGDLSPTAARELIDGAIAELEPG